MRLVLFIMLAVCMQASARGYAQATVTLSEKNAPLQKIFRDIHQQTGYQFFYEDALLDKAGRLDIEVKNAPLDQVLLQCFRNLPLSFSIVNKTIVVKAIAEIPKPDPPTNPSVPPPADIHGRVTDSLGNPLAGASVTIKGSRKGTSTDASGNFELKGVDEHAILVISFTGFADREYKWKGNNSFTIVLERSTSQLDQAQVIAYGTTTQRYNVGSVSKVTAEDIASQPVSNPLQALEGRVPGLVVNQTSGLPGSAITIQIRGQNSLNPSTSFSVPPMDQPLFIIDGVPFAPQNEKLNQYHSLASPSSSVGDFYNNPNVGISPFNSINPADIESMEVLRDADATAIYGSRGANGVLLITTKKGKAGKTKFNATVWTGQNYVPLDHTPTMMNTQQYTAMRREAYKNDKITNLPANAYDINGVYDTTRYTDWKKFFLGGTAQVTDANLSLSGGTANTQFLIGAGMHRETYIFPGDFSDNKASVNMNLHHRSADQRLMIDFSVNYSYDKNNSTGNQAGLTAFTLSPDYPSLFTPDGNINWMYKSAYLVLNPGAYLKQAYNGQILNLLSHFQIGYQVLPGLTIKSDFGYNTTDFNEYTAMPKGSQIPAINPTAYASFGTNNYQTWIIEPQAQYRKKIGKGMLELLLGSTFQQNINNSTSVSGSNYPNDALLGSISGAGIREVDDDGYNLYKYSAVFGRINYVWDKKYILNMTGRRDGSSRFGPGRQFGDFGSIGAGWIFSEENFMKRLIPGLSYGKIRASYGTTGSDGIGNYQYLANWKPTDYSYQNQVGYTPQNLYKPDFSWSLTKKLEVGMELGFFKDRLLANISWYQNRCGNQLVSYALPIQTGFSEVTANFDALVQNRGWEIQLSSTIVKTTRFSWNSSVNLSIPKNKLISFPGLANSGYSYYYVVGQPLSVLQKVHFVGINDTTGLYQFSTAQGAPTYYPNTVSGTKGGDARIIGNTDPEFYGGFRNTVTYKGLQLDIFFEFRRQLGANYIQQINANTDIGKSVNEPVEALDRWQQPGDKATFQRFSQNGSVSSTQHTFSSSDAAYSDASFIRCKTVSLSYNLPDRYTRKIKADGCRIYVNMQNLFTITDYKGDPETMSFYGIPPLKTIVAGLQFNF